MATRRLAQRAQALASNFGAAAPLWEAVEKIIPDIRSRLVVEMVASPLTHERYLRRRRGTYGPELRAGRRDFPGATTMVDGLYVCGDSAWPGIGVPAVAGSGIAAVHAFVPVEKQKALLDELLDVLRLHGSAACC